uniref:Ovule protein n=1 Tax=Bursaphelenchus xylophilus TaxID=6326 RepID=A0A1I7S7W8_BURXY
MRWNQIKGGGPNQDNCWSLIGEDQVRVDKFWVSWGHFDVKIMENWCWIGCMEMKWSDWYVDIRIELK